MENKLLTREINLKPCALEVIENTQRLTGAGFDECLNALVNFHFWTIADAVNAGIKFDLKAIERDGLEVENGNG